MDVSGSIWDHEVEKILAIRTKIIPKSKDDLIVLSNPPLYECLVKFVGLSYLSSTWEAEQDILSDMIGNQKYKHYKKQCEKMGIPWLQNSHCKVEDLVPVDYLMIERIISKKFVENIFDDNIKSPLESPSHHDLVQESPSSELGNFDFSRFSHRLISQDTNSFVSDGATEVPLKEHMSVSSYPGVTETDFIRVNLNEPSQYESSQNQNPLPYVAIRMEEDGEHEVEDDEEVNILESIGSESELEEENDHSENEPEAEAEAGEEVDDEEETETPKAKSKRGGFRRRHKKKWSRKKTSGSKLKKDSGSTDFDLPSPSSPGSNRRCSRSESITSQTNFDLSNPIEENINKLISSERQDENQTNKSLESTSSSITRKGTKRFSESTRSKFADKDEVEYRGDLERKAKRSLERVPKKGWRNSEVDESEYFQEDEDIKTSSKRKKKYSKSTTSKTKKERTQSKKISLLSFGESGLKSSKGMSAIEERAIGKGETGTHEGFRSELSKDQSDENTQNLLKVENSGEPKQPLPLIEMYLVKWRGLGYSECTWELAEDIEDADFHVSRFEESMSTLQTRLPEEERKAEAHVKETQNSFPSLGSDSSLAFPSLESSERLSSEGMRNISEIISQNNPTTELHDYQLSGVKWLLFQWSQQRSSILADEMGLGKTIQSIVFLDCLRDSRIGNLGLPVLILAPLSTLKNWQREFESHSRSNLVILHGNGQDRKLFKQYETTRLNDKNEASALGVESEGESDRKAGKRKSSYPFSSLPHFQVLLSSYELALTEMSFLRQIEWGVVIVDEAHRLKNDKSQLFQNLSQVHSSFRLLLTGTPIQNNTAELFSLLHFIQPQDFPDKARFLQSYDSIQSNQAQVESLQSELKRYLLRREKGDVSLILPPKSVIVIDVELTVIQKQYYKAVLDRNRKFLSRGPEKRPPQLINILMELRKVCNHPFLINGAQDAICEEFQASQSLPGLEDTSLASLDPALDDPLVLSSGKLVLLHKLLKKFALDNSKCLIFSQFTMTLDILEEFLTKYSYQYERIDGQTSGIERSEAIDRFNGRHQNNRKAKMKSAHPTVFLLSTRSGGVGINLQAANTVIIFDSDWNPQLDVQAISRCHRIGQSKEVKVYRMVTRKSIETQIFSQANKKLELTNVILNGNDPTKDGKTGEAGPNDEQNLESILRNSAIELLSEDSDTAKAKSQDYIRDDIEHILEVYSKEYTFSDSGYQEKGKADQGKDGEGPTTAGEKPKRNSTFSVATFTSSDSNQSVDIDDQDFWEKVLPAKQSTIQKLIEVFSDEESRWRLQTAPSLLNSYLESVLKIARETNFNRQSGDYPEETPEVIDLLNVVINDCGDLFRSSISELKLLLFSIVKPKRHRSQTSSGSTESKNTVSMQLRELNSSKSSFDLSLLNDQELDIDNRELNDVTLEGDIVIKLLDENFDSDPDPSRGGRKKGKASLAAVKGKVGGRVSKSMPPPERIMPVRTKKGVNTHFDPSPETISESKPNTKSVVESDFNTYQSQQAIFNIQQQHFQNFKEQRHNDLVLDELRKKFIAPGILFARSILPFYKACYSTYYDEDFKSFISLCCNLLTEQDKIVWNQHHNNLETIFTEYLIKGHNVNVERVVDNYLNGVRDSQFFVKYRALVETVITKRSEDLGRPNPLAQGQRLEMPALLNLKEAGSSCSPASNQSSSTPKIDENKSNDDDDDDDDDDEIQIIPNPSIATLKPFQQQRHQPQQPQQQQQQQQQHQKPQPESHLNVPSSSNLSQQQPPAPFSPQAIPPFPMSGISTPGLAGKGIGGIGPYGYNGIFPMPLMGAPNGSPQGYFPPFGMGPMGTPAYFPFPPNSTTQNNPSSIGNNNGNGNGNGNGMYKVSVHSNDTYSNPSAQKSSLQDSHNPKSQPIHKQVHDSSSASSDATTQLKTAIKFGEMNPSELYNNEESESPEMVSETENNRLNEKETRNLEAKKGPKEVPTPQIIYPSKKSKSGEFRDAFESEYRQVLIAYSQFALPPPSVDILPDGEEKIRRIMLARLFHQRRMEILDDLLKELTAESPNVQDPDYLVRSLIDPKKPEELKDSSSSSSSKGISVNTNNTDNQQPNPPQHQDAKPSISLTGKTNDAPVDETTNSIPSSTSHLKLESPSHHLKSSHLETQLPKGASILSPQSLPSKESASSFYSRQPPTQSQPLNPSPTSQPHSLPQLQLQPQTQNRPQSLNQTQSTSQSLPQQQLRPQSLTQSQSSVQVQLPQPHPHPHPQLQQTPQMLNSNIQSQNQHQSQFQHPAFQFPQYNNFYPPKQNFSLSPSQMMSLGLKGPNGEGLSPAGLMNPMGNGMSPGMGMLGMGMPMGMPMGMMGMPPPNFYPGFHPGMPGSGWMGSGGPMEAMNPMAFAAMMGGGGMGMGMGPSNAPQQSQQAPRAGGSTTNAPTPPNPNHGANSGVGRSMAPPLGMSYKP